MLVKASIIICFVLLFPCWLHAGHQVCGNRAVGDGVRRCPDGSIPLFVADETRLAAPAETATSAKAGNDPASTDPSDLKFYFGVWRTNIPGASWTSPSGYQGYDWLHVSAGVSSGDLIVRPDGTYLWNSYGGKSGRWVRGDAQYPIVLIDTVEDRKWKVGLDQKHANEGRIYIWDGKYYYYIGRK